MTISPLWTIDDEPMSDAERGAWEGVRRDMQRAWYEQADAEDAAELNADDAPGADVVKYDEFWRNYENWQLKDDDSGMDN